MTTMKMTYLTSKISNMQMIWKCISQEEWHLVKWHLLRQIRQLKNVTVHPVIKRLIVKGVKWSVNSIMVAHC